MSTHDSSTETGKFSLFFRNYPKMVRSGPTKLVGSGPRDWVGLTRGKTLVTQHKPRFFDCFFGKFSVRKVGPNWSKFRVLTRRSRAKTEKNPRISWSRWSVVRGGPGENGRGSSGEIRGIKWSKNLCCVA